MFSHICWWMIMYLSCSAGQWKLLHMSLWTTLLDALTESPLFSWRFSPGRLIFSKVSMAGSSGPLSVDHACHAGCTSTTIISQSCAYDDDDDDSNLTRLLMAVGFLLSINSFMSSLWIPILRARTIPPEKRVMAPSLLHLLLKAHAFLGPVLLQILKATGLSGLPSFSGGWYSLYGSWYGYRSTFFVCSISEVVQELLRVQEGTNVVHLGLVLARLCRAKTMMCPTVLLIEDAESLRIFILLLRSV